MQNTLYDNIVGKKNNETYMYLIQNIKNKKKQKQKQAQNRQRENVNTQLSLPKKRILTFEHQRCRAHAFFCKDQTTKN